MDKKIGVNCPKKLENAKILIANTQMDADKIKIFGTRVRVDSAAKVAEIEAAENLKMKQKVDKILAHGMNCFINRQLVYAEEAEEEEKTPLVPITQLLFAPQVQLPRAAFVRGGCHGD